MTETQNTESPNPEGTLVRLRGIRRTAAKRMVAAWEAPMFHLTVEPDVTAVLRFSSEREGVTLTDCFIAAAAHALRQVPDVNVHVGDGHVIMFDRAHIGVAVATDAGLIVPVIRDADLLTLTEISDRRRELVLRARRGELAIDDVTGGTFTISNLGMTSVTRFDAIVNPPEAAIIAIGTTRRVPVPSDSGALDWRQTAAITLTADHRALDGATGARFLQAYETWLSAPTASAPLGSA